MNAPVRFRFGQFVLSPRQRLLSRDGVAVPLIPKYFDLLFLLIARRHEAVSKQLIFERVWTDVVVSDGALAQAVRTLRRTLGDDSREPRFIRTVSRHGYQFIWPDVVEEADDQPHQPDQPHPCASARSAMLASDGENLDDLVERLLKTAALGDAARDEARDIAERLHTLGTEKAMARLIDRPHHAAAIAAMRDARWSVPGAREVPLLRDREALRAILAVIRLRIADVKRTMALRWLNAAGCGGLGGAIAGACGGIVLTLSPASNARPQSAIALAAIGAVAGGIGAGGVAAGLAAAEALARSRRGLALVACGALFGAIVAGAADLVLRALLDALFGIRLLHVSAAIDGLVMGAAAGGGYAIATVQPPGGGIAAPHGQRRATAVSIVGVCCALAATALALTGRPLVGGLVHEVARLSRGTELVLSPLGYVIGEPGFSPLTRSLLSALEGGTFGCALAWGFTRRPKSANPFRSSSISPTSL